MSELDKLKLQLKNLKDKGHEEFSINVIYLLNILENLPKQSPLPKRFNVDWVDGGNFADD